MLPPTVLGSVTLLHNTKSPVCLWDSESRTCSPQNRKSLLQTISNKWIGKLWRKCHFQKRCDCIAVWVWISWCWWLLLLGRRWPNWRPGPGGEEMEQENPADATRTPGTKILLPCWNHVENRLNSCFVGFVKKFSVQIWCHVPEWLVSCVGTHPL